MLKNGVKISEEHIQGYVAEFFDENVQGLVCDTVVNPRAYKEKSKLHDESKFFGQV
jgi:hypothetical protein